MTKQIHDKLQALLAQVAQLSIDTVPGLEVYVDEKLAGRAPLKGFVVVTLGTHVVTVGNPEAGTLGAEVVAKAGQVHRVDLSAWKPRERQTSARGPTKRLPPPPPAEAVAFLSGRSNRVGAAVQVDGQLRRRTPLANVALAPGPHEIVVRSGRQSVSSTVTLAAEERAPWA
ncbi:MAG: PEGA domain-containing protein [Myxococcales bacterium]|nr:PEGA domain-containing protein [Myxococcota bacterium]MDW8282630.1 PEGA domain-containing protein [Myxococcales bacterium]